MRPPVPKRVTAASSRLAPWGRFRHISGRRRFEDDHDGSVPGMSHTGAGRVASPRLGIGRSGVSIRYAAYHRGTTVWHDGFQDFGLRYLYDWVLRQLGVRAWPVAASAMLKPCEGRPALGHPTSTAPSAAPTGKLRLTMPAANSRRSNLKLSCDKALGRFLDSAFGLRRSSEAVFADCLENDGFGTHAELKSRCGASPLAKISKNRLGRGSCGRRCCLSLGRDRLPSINGHEGSRHRTRSTP